jgi:hypothetical protein
MFRLRGWNRQGYCRCSYKTPDEAGQPRSYYRFVDRVNRRFQAHGYQNIQALKRKASAIAGPAVER